MIYHSVINNEPEI